MKAFRQFCLLTTLIAVFGFSSLLSLAARAMATVATVEPQSPNEADIAKISKLTGLAKNTVTMAFGKSPGLLSKLNDTVLAIKVLNEFSEAKDDKALEDLYNFAQNKLKDQVLAAPLNSALAAFRAYKTSLEVIRDCKYIPEIDDQIYQRYRTSRLEDRKRGIAKGPESRTTAFETATSAQQGKGLLGVFPSSGYYAIREKMYDEMIKAKGYNKELIGKQFENRLRAQIDDFWRCRLEAKLQQEVLREQRTKLESQIWKDSGLVESLRAEVARVERTPVAKRSGKAGTSTVKNDPMPAGEQKPVKLQTAFDVRPTSVKSPVYTDEVKNARDMAFHFRDQSVTVDHEFKIPVNNSGVKSQEHGKYQIKGEFVEGRLVGKGSLVYYTRDMSQGVDFAEVRWEGQVSGEADANGKMVVKCQWKAIRAQQRAASSRADVEGISWGEWKPWSFFEKRPKFFEMEITLQLPVETPQSSHKPPPPINSYQSKSRDGTRNEIA